MLNIYISGEYRTAAWFGPTQPRPFRYPVCVIDSSDREHIEFAQHNTDMAWQSHDRDGIVLHGFETVEDGLTPDEFDIREREAARAERLFCQPREYFL